jgi:hypothetical protein
MDVTVHVMQKKGSIVKCRNCRSKNTRVTCTQHQDHIDQMWQYRRCLDCSTRFKTICTYAINRPGPKLGSKGAIKNVGSANQNAILTERNVRDIRTLARKGLMQKTIAEKYGLSSATINRIVLRKAWRHVP